MTSGHVLKYLCLHRNTHTKVQKVTYSSRWRPWSLSGKESACIAGDSGSVPGSGSSPAGGNGHTLQYSCLGNPRDRGAWRAAVREVPESDTAKHGTTKHALVRSSLSANARRRPCMLLILSAFCTHQYLPTSKLSRQRICE